MISRRRLTGCLVLSPIAVFAQGSDPNWRPQRPITFVVPFSAGSGTDMLARIMAPSVAAELGVNVVVENRGGAGGTLATAAVVRGRPDGYTLVVSGTSTVPINRTLYPNLGFDPHRDLAPVGVAVTTPNALVVRADSPFRSVEDLIAALRDPARPTRHWSTGNGTSQHLSGVQLLRAVGGNAEHIPYRGPSEGVAGLLAGDTEWGFSALPAIAGLARDGRIRILGITGTQQDPSLPNTPTLASRGLSTFSETDVWIGLAVPRPAPPEVIATLRAAFSRAQPAMAARLTSAGFTPAAAMDPVELELFVDKQVSFWEQLVTQAGARIE